MARLGRVVLLFLRFLVTRPIWCKRLTRPGPLCKFACVLQVGVLLVVLCTSAVSALVSWSCAFHRVAVGRVWKAAASCTARPPTPTAAAVIVRTPTAATCTAATCTAATCTAAIFIAAYFIVFPTLGESDHEANGLIVVIFCLLLPHVCPVLVVIANEFHGDELVGDTRLETLEPLLLLHVVLAWRYIVGTVRGRWVFVHERLHVRPPSFGMPPFAYLQIIQGWRN